MALKQIDHGSEEYQQMVMLRYEMLRRPLGLNFTSDELDKEQDDILIGAYEEEELLGCCMLTRVSEDAVRLRQMAVHQKLQGKGIGASLMRFAENLARDRGFRSLIMHARKTAIGFYEKQGYQTKGDEFLEVTIPHYVMEKILR